MVRVGINGLGAMGRYLMRARQIEINQGKLRQDGIEIVAFNDLASVEQLANLVAHDSVYRGFKRSTSIQNRCFAEHKNHRKQTSEHS